MRSTFKGIIHGKTIELEKKSGLRDGQEVSIPVEPAVATTSPTSLIALEALRRAAGAWAEDGEELDRYLEWNRLQHKGSRPEVCE